MAGRAKATIEEPQRVGEYRARRDFTFNGTEVRRGELVTIEDTRKARGMMTARLVADPLEVA